MGLITDNLNNLIQSDMYPFHMPGGKRAASLLKLDITEIEGFDDLHHPEGIIKKAMEKAANIYGADKSFFLVNGSTAGILTAISACTKAGDEIIIARNAHRSVYNAVELMRLKAKYVIPDVMDIGCYDALSPDLAIKAIDDNPEAKVMVLTSPTYEGQVSDIEAIGRYAHEKGVILIVDEAHGAHMYFHKDFPKGALSGADIVIQSLHKTLPALTPAAVMHIKGDRVDPKKIQKYLSIYQTSSPSYILMACIEDVLDDAISDERPWQRYVDRLDNFYKEVSSLKNLEVLDFQGRDKGKIVLYHKERKVSGLTLSGILRNKYHLECEYASPYFVLLMTSVMDSDEGFERLIKAIKEMDETNLDIDNVEVILPPAKNHEMVLIPADAAEKEAEEIQYLESEGRVSGENIYIYPPGRVYVAEGERITREDIEYITYLKKTGFDIRGINNNLISVVRGL